MLKFQLSMISGMTSILPEKYAYIFNIMAAIFHFRPDREKNVYCVFRSTSATAWYMNYYR